LEDKILKIIAEETGIGLWQAKAAADLIDSGCTVPFIARYRKEATGAMEDEALRTFDERLRYLRNLEDRKQTIIAAIEEQGKLTVAMNSPVYFQKFMRMVYDGVYDPNDGQETTVTMDARTALEHDLGLI
jgi:uncharacterized protein